MLPSWRHLSNAGAKDEPHRNMGFDMRQKCKSVFVALCRKKKKIYFQQFLGTSTVSSFPVQVCTSLSLVDKRAYLHQDPFRVCLLFSFFFAWYLNLLNHQHLHDTTILGRLCFCEPFQTILLHRIVPATWSLKHQPVLSNWPWLKHACTSHRL